MPEPMPVRIPLENVNDETVKLVAWLVEEGAEVHEGEGLAEVETSKATFELTAPVSGRVWRKVSAGEDIAVGSVVCCVGADAGGAAAEAAVAPPAPAGGAETEPAAGPQTAPAALPPGTRFSKPALDMLRRHGVDPRVFAGRGMVREQDVQKHLDQLPAAGAEGAPPHFALRGISLAGVTLPAALGDADRGNVDPQWLEYLRTNLSTFGQLSSAEKCAAYRRHGAEIGDGVSLGPGTVIVAPQIRLGDGASIGENGLVLCRERFVAGALTSFRANLSVRGGTVVLGDNVFGGTNVQIGGGGHADPWSLLCVGDLAYIGDDVFINICRPVLIGQKVFLTHRSMLVTHNVGHSVLEGYENRFAPIVLEDGSQVGLQCTVYAGSRIGRFAIVGSNSYVISSIPAGKLAIGVPARVVREAARPPDRRRQVQIAHTMVREFQELLALKGCQVAALAPASLSGFTAARAGKRFGLLFVERYPAPGAALCPADESVIWTLDAGDAGPPPGGTLMDLLAKRVAGPGGVFVDAAREFLRKRGIRCEPGLWRYHPDLI